MSNIVAGHFQLQDQIEHARNELMRAGFAEDRISSFFLNQPGQHDMTAIGGDRDKSPGAEESQLGVVEGAAAGGAVGAAIGLATSVVTGPLGPAVGGLVGAHVGSLYTLSTMKEAGEGEAGGTGENRFEPRKPGMLVAVAADGPGDEEKALEVLRRLGSDHIERAHGTIEQGDWTDFDPLSLPVLIH
ncbi:MAG: hypothetical protein V4631_18335 [Pseudomonadota bacterium]